MEMNEGSMAKYKASDVSEFIILRCNDIGNKIDDLKMQKMLYFVWMDYFKKTRMELFSDPFEAWECGPVVVSVYNKYKSFGDRSLPYSGRNDISEEDRKILIPFIDKYSALKGSELVRKSHMRNGPWYEVYEYGKKHIVIDRESMKKYTDPKLYAEDEMDLRLIDEITSKPDYKEKCVDSDEFFKSIGIE